MNKYTVILDCDDYPDHLTFECEADRFADAEAMALKVYNINCYIISITKNNNVYGA